MKKAFISTVPFGTVSRKPIDLLKKNNIEYIINPFDRKIKPHELFKFVSNIDYLIAGTEKLTDKLLSSAKNLKLISRVGIGLDNIPFSYTNEKDIKVTCTPDAPTKAVSELVIGLMIDCMRKISPINWQMKNGHWNKYMGNLLLGKTIGIIGTGRIGGDIIRLLQPFNVNIIANDIKPNKKLEKKYKIRYYNKKTIFQQSDIISLNLSYSQGVNNLICKREISQMKKNVNIINTARGELINENDLYDALMSNKINCVALDVFKEEPYKGKLLSHENVIALSHIGAATIESRKMMELGAVEEVVRFHNNKQLLNEVKSNTI